MNSQNITKEIICKYLKEGMFKKDAALMAGISEKTLYRWIEEDDSFDSQVEASILEYKHSLIKVITKQAEKNGILALRILQTRWPKDWPTDPQKHIDFFNERKVIRPLVVSDVTPYVRQAAKEREEENSIIVSDV